MNRTRVAVIGENLMDVLASDDGGLVAVPGGGPFNVARTVARLGQPCDFFSGLSEDPYGRAIRECLHEDGVDLALRPVLARPTATALVDRTGSSATYRFLLDESATFQVDPTSLAGPWRSVEPLTNSLCVGGLGIAFEPMAGTILGLLDGLSDQILVAVDPNCRPSATSDDTNYRRSLWRVLERADVVKSSVEDLKFLCPGVSVSEAVARIARLGATCVIVTDGPLPVQVCLETTSFTLDVPEADVVDTIGAGDALLGGFLAWWVLSGLGRPDLANAPAIREAVSTAIRVAVVTCGRAGAVPPRRVEVSSFGLWTDVDR